MVRKYKTNWSVMDCIGFLQRKNVYDVQHYDFYTAHNNYYIRFKGVAKILGSYVPDIDDSMDITYINFEYIVTFEEIDNETIISVRAQSRDYDPHISEQDMDEFFFKKLDAILFVR